MARPFSKEWEDETVTISRKEFAEIITEEIMAATTAARMASDNDMADFIKELLVNFSAGIGSEIFSKEDLEI